MLLDRLFTAGSLRPQDSMRFVRACSFEHTNSPDIMVPDSWSLEAAESFKQALYLSAPATQSSVEENTMPSWLWQHKGKDNAVKAESSVLDVFARIAGAATYRGWKLGLWQDEITASTFYDEIYAILLTRRLVLAPQDMARMGLDWAYGLQAAASKEKPIPADHIDALILQNESIDSILRRSEPQTQNKWNRFLQESLLKPQTHVAFADTIAEWGQLPVRHNVPRATINLMSLRTTDGTIDLAALDQTTKCAVLLLELYYEELSTSPRKNRPMALGFGNLSELLMSLALPYDSNKARGTAASLAAIITATANCTSARIAAQLSPYETFGNNREQTLRALRNMLRATFGEKNDYDHLSVLPQVLEITSGTDLVLISKARYACEEALKLAQQFGLRHGQLTSLVTDETLAPLLDATSQGIDAEAALTCDYAIDGDQFERRVRPAIILGLEKLGYDDSDIKAAVDHLEGYKTLKAAPAINHRLLRDKGFDEATLNRIEGLLPFVNHLNLVFTPWVVGPTFCRETLQIKETEMKSASFNLLHTLGFTSKEIEVANAFCCGHATLHNCLDLTKDDRAIFNTRANIDPKAQLKMAGAVQSFMTGDVGMCLQIPASLTSQLRSKLVIQAWELGLKGISLELESPYRTGMVAQDGVSVMKRKTPSLQKERETIDRTSGHARAIKPKATSRTISLKQKAKKPLIQTKRS